MNAYPVIKLSLIKSQPLFDISLLFCEILKTVKVTETSYFFFILRYIKISFTTNESKWIFWKKIHLLHEFRIYRLISERFGISFLLNSDSSGRTVLGIRPNREIRALLCCKGTDSCHAWRWSQPIALATNQTDSYL